MVQSNAFLYNMPAGIPGMVNRVGGRGPDIEAQIMDPTHPLPFYGLAGKIDLTTGLFRTLETTDTTIYGVLVRPFPTQPLTASGFSGASPLGTPAVPPQFQTAIDVLKQGYMTVILQNTTASVKSGVVYVRVDAAAGSLYIGGFEAADDGSNTVPVANAYFMGPADANGNVEIAFNNFSQ